MTDARHSSGYVDNGQMVYMGEPGGYVVPLEDRRTIYFAGDTCLFGDMRLIGEIYRRDCVPADRRSVHDGPACRGAGVRVARVCSRWCRCTGERFRCSPARPRSESARPAERGRRVGAQAWRHSRVGVATGPEWSPGTGVRIAEQDVVVVPHAWAVFRLLVTLVAPTAM